MEKFDWAWIQAHGKSLRKTDTPKPFPGIHPLRIAARILYKMPGDKKDRLFEYIGKPNKIIARRAWRIIDRAVEGAAGLWEFDRGGPICTYVSDLPQGLLSSIAQQNQERLCRYYRYHFRNSPALLWISDLEPVKVDYDGKEHVMYGNAFAERHWREYREWLDANSQQLSL